MCDGVFYTAPLSICHTFRRGVFPDGLLVTLLSWSLSLRSPFLMVRPHSELPTEKGEWRLDGSTEDLARNRLLLCPDTWHPSHPRVSFDLRLGIWVSKLLTCSDAMKEGIRKGGPKIEW